jgi:hypothetical protein
MTAVTLNCTFRLIDSGESVLETGSLSSIMHRSYGPMRARYLHPGDAGVMLALGKYPSF